MKTYKPSVVIASMSLLLSIACICLLLSGCVADGNGNGNGDGNGQPDLVVTTLETTGTPTVNLEGSAVVPIRVVVENQGDAAADIFKVSTAYTGTTGTYGVAFTVSGQSNMWYPYTSDPLAAGDDVTFAGNLTFVSSVHGVTVNITATADSCSGDEFMPDYCRVEESNEDNNESTPISVSLP
jgi:hypothetical protein